MGLRCLVWLSIGRFVFLGFYTTHIWATKPGKETVTTRLRFIHRMIWDLLGYDLEHELENSKPWQGVGGYGRVGNALGQSRTASGNVMMMMKQ